MITDIPTADDFQAAGLNQLYLAWQIAIQALEDHEQLSDTVDVYDGESAAQEYWRKSQPALANALGLAQQAMEMALKGRIAAVSPYLLISRDPKEWPKGVDVQSVAFSEFRTLDATDLIKVHNTFAAMPLDQRFSQFWDGVRRDRNRVMHSVTPRNFEPAALIRTILTAVETLFAEVSWPERLLTMEAEGKYAAYGLDDGTQNVVMKQVDMAVRHLDPAEALRFLDHDTRRRAYVCPVCYYRANRDWQDEWPRLAQLPARQRGATDLRCVVCTELTEVIREPCTNCDCRGDVIYDGMCLTCLHSQDDPGHFVSGLTDDTLDREHGYHFEFGRGGRGLAGRREATYRSCRTTGPRGSTRVWRCSPQSCWAGTPSPSRPIDRAACSSHRLESGAGYWERGSARRTCLPGGRITNPTRSATGTSHRPLRRAPNSSAD